MKKQTMVKVLNRYCRGLDAMCKQAYADNEPKDAKQYEFDLQTLEQVRDFIIENYKERK